MRHQRQKLTALEIFSISQDNYVNIGEKLNNSFNKTIKLNYTLIYQPSNKKFDPALKREPFPKIKRSFDSPQKAIVTRSPHSP